MLQTPHTCELDRLYWLHKIRLLHFKPVQQLGDEAHDVELRSTESWFRGLSQAARRKARARLRAAAAARRAGPPQLGGSSSLSCSGRTA